MRGREPNQSSVQRQREVAARLCGEIDAGVVGAAPVSVDWGSSMAVELA
ncbi:MAG: hypothetical protein WBG38_09955 [Nodosilinea sp.]